MLYDRAYMRAGGFGVRRSWTLTLIVILGVVYVLQNCLEYYAHLPVDDWLALSWHGLKQGRVWQLFTFQFLHATPLPFHLLFNCLGLYFLGRTLEGVLGAPRFLSLYFLCGFGGGLVQVLATILLPFYSDGGTVGASAGVMGLLGAFALLYPMEQLTIWIMVFPVTLRAQYLLWAALAFSGFGTLFPFGDVAHGAHLGGLLTSLACLRWRWHEKILDLDWRRLWPRKAPRKVVPLTKPAFMPNRPNRTPSAGPVYDDFMSREVDPILDKISAQGIHSLTAEERRVLEKARERMARR